MKAETLQHLKKISPRMQVASAPNASREHAGGAEVRTVVFLFHRSHLSLDSYADESR